MTVVYLNEKCLLINHVYCAILPVVSSFKIFLYVFIMETTKVNDEKVKIAIFFIDQLPVRLNLLNYQWCFLIATGITNESYSLIKYSIMLKKLENICIIYTVKKKAIM